MGKASKWLVNLLLGRKEDKGKKTNITFYGEKIVTTPITSLSSTPSHKRRWSFGKSSSKESGVHRSSKSHEFDLNTIAPIITPTVSSLELENQHKKAKAVALAFAIPEAIKNAVIPINASGRIRRTVENAVATRIQATFRSYLARKALCALKGLVKLQALVRGHLVRKQTTATLQRMHAMLVIQVRARCLRIEMAREPRPVIRSKSSRHKLSNQASGCNFTHKGPVDTDTCGTHGISNKQNGYLSQPTKGSSGDLTSILKQQHLRRETYFTTPKTIPGRASFTSEQPDYVPPAASESPSQPNYFANPKSFRATARSQSEPKQRPEWSVRPTSKRRASIDGMNVQKDAHTRYRSLQNEQEQLDPWLTRMYRSARLKENPGDAIAKITL